MPDGTIADAWRTAGQAPRERVEWSMVHVLLLGCAREFGLTEEDVASWPKPCRYLTLADILSSSRGGDEEASVWHELGLKDDLGRSARGSSRTRRGCGGQ